MEHGVITQAEFGQAKRKLLASSYFDLKKSGRCRRADGGMLPVLGMALACGCSFGDFADLGEVVGEDAVPAPDLCAGESVEHGAVPA